MKKQALFIFLIASPLWASWLIPNQIWWNSGTGQVYYNQYPTGVPTFTSSPTKTFTNTATPTATSTVTSTATPTATKTATSTSTATPTITFTPTPTFTFTVTPTPYGNALNVPNVILSGKMIASASEPSTISSNVCTVTHTSHGYTTGDLIIMTGSPTGGGTFSSILRTITGTTTNTYTFATAGLSNGPVTSAAETYWFSGSRSLNSSLISSIGRSGTGDAAITFTNTQADSNYPFYATLGNGSNWLVFRVASISTAQIDLNVATSDTATATNATTVFDLFFAGIR